MSSAFQPKGLENWITILDDHLLPILPKSARQLAKLLKNPDASPHDFGELIAADPVMRVHVIRECNRQFGDKAAGTLANPHHCAAMLGLDKLTILLRQLKATKGDGKDPRDTHYFQAIRTSLHAAEQAASWAAFRHQTTPDAMFMGALMYGVPNWGLWRFAHKEMAVIDTLFRRERVPREEAEQAVLGCTRSAIALALARRWHIPDGIAAALAPDQLPGPRFLLRHAHRHARDPGLAMPNRTPEGILVNSPALPIALSNTLAQEAARDWYSRQTQRCLSIVAAYLEQPLDVVLHHSKQVAVAASQQWALPGTVAPATNLIWPAHPPMARRLKPKDLPNTVARYFASNQAAKPAAPKAASPAPSKPAPPKPIGMHSEHLPEDLDRRSILGAPKPAAPTAQTTSPFPGFTTLEKRREFEQLMQKLLQDPDYFSTEYESIRCVVDILADTTPLTRVLVATYNRPKHTLDAYYARGCDDAPLLRKCTISLQHSNLFSQLLKQPAAVWISPDRPSAVSGLVPGTFKQAAQCDHFFAMSLFNHRGAYGLFYADHGTGDRIGLSEAEYKVFKVASATCTKHLIARGKRAAAKRSQP